MARAFENLIAVDVETSGPDPFLHQLLSVAVVPLDANFDPIRVFIRHDKIEWGGDAKIFFSSYEEDWKQLGMDIPDAFRTLETYFQRFPHSELVLVGHNVGFDHSFLKKLVFQAGKRKFSKVSHRAIDTHTMLYLLFLLGKIPFEALTSDGAFDYFSIIVPPGRRHTALADAIATKSLFEKLVSCFRTVTPSHHPIHGPSL